MRNDDKIVRELVWPIGTTHRAVSFIRMIRAIWYSYNNIMLRVKLKDQELVYSYIYGVY